jgi:SAM-dependent MidA family methyltransferase
MFPDFPQPSDTVLERSHTLSALIRQKIEQQGGFITFAHFMDEALYHPELGYYNTDTFALGKEGDFITAPEISPIFAQCFAQQCQQILTQLDKKNILEFGAGTGRFAKDLLFALNHLDCLPQYYYILEPSMTLRKKQRDFLSTAYPAFIKRIIWLDSTPADFTGIVIANEVLDALPVHGFRIEGNRVKESFVAWEKNQFVRLSGTPISMGLVEKVSVLRDLYSLGHGYESEINLRLPSFIQNMADMLKQGLILLADYGYGQREYYHPARCHGTLSCFYQHHRHNNPLILPGSQDITAHVDFTSVVSTATERGCALAGYTTQAGFLLACGLSTLVSTTELSLTPVEKFNLHQAIKYLTLPTEMGENIKIMALTKHLDSPLLGFTLQDRRRDL